MYNYSQGFTLIELLIVLAIIGLLAAVLVPHMLSTRAKANDAATMAFLRHCVSAMEIQRSQEGSVVPATTCDDPRLGTTAQTRPSATTATNIVTTTDLSEYTIEATSASGHVFKYQNGLFGQLP